VGSSALVNNQIDLESPGLLGFEGCLFTQLFCRGSNGWGVWGMEVEEVVGGGVFVSHQATSRGGGGGRIEIDVPDRKNSHATEANRLTYLAFM
jgi:hypothetical protein